MVKRKFPRTGLKGKRRFGLLVTDLQIGSEALNRGEEARMFWRCCCLGHVCAIHRPLWQRRTRTGFKFSSVRAFAVGRQKEMLVDIRVFYASSVLHQWRDFAGVVHGVTRVARLGANRLPDPLTKDASTDNLGNDDRNYEQNQRSTN